MSGRRRNPVKTLFKIETLTPNSVIIIRAGSAIDTQNYMKQLASELTKRGMNKIVILRLASLDDFHALNEEQMNKLGWWKKEKEDESNPA